MTAYGSRCASESRWSAAPILARRRVKMTPGEDDGAPRRGIRRTDGRTTSLLAFTTRVRLSSLRHRIAPHRTADTLDEFRRTRPAESGSLVLPTHNGRLDLLPSRCAETPSFYANRFRVSQTSPGAGSSAHLPLLIVACVSYVFISTRRVSYCTAATEGDVSSAPDIREASPVRMSSLIDLRCFPRFSGYEEIRDRGCNRRVSSFQRFYEKRVPLAHYSRVPKTVIGFRERVTRG